MERVIGLVDSQTLGEAIKKRAYMPSYMWHHTPTLKLLYTNTQTLLVCVVYYGTFITHIRPNEKWSEM